MNASFIYHEPYLVGQYEKLDELQVSELPSASIRAVVRTATH